MAKPPDPAVLRPPSNAGYAAGPAPVPAIWSREDALEYLRCSTVSIFRKSCPIYDPEQASDSLYLVIDGRVKVSRVAENGLEVVTDIYLPDEFFGEDAFVSGRRVGRAVALEDTQLMTWAASEVQETIEREPRLGLALVQIAVQRILEFRERIGSLSADNVARRLARSLIRFSERMGRPLEDGSLLIAPLTHGVLAQYVGTSREIVTLYMTQFRRQGLLQYSRRGIVLHREGLAGWLAENG
jgi:CRP/FNR family cyclic AMP-dependent transcriptional regulator